MSNYRRKGEKMKLLTKLLDAILPADIKHLKIASFGYFMLTIALILMLYYFPQQHILVYLSCITFVLSSVAVKPPTLGGGYKATHTL